MEEFETLNLLEMIRSLSNERENGSLHKILNLVPVVLFVLLHSECKPHV